jgi:hypothetical protein
MVKFTELRTLATLRRIAKAMERANQLEERRQEVEYATIKESGPIRKMVFSRPTTEDWNEKVIGRHGSI